MLAEVQDNVVNFPVNQQYLEIQIKILSNSIEVSANTQFGSISSLKV